MHVSGNNVFLQVKRLTESAELPKYLTDGSAGMDLVADILEPLFIWPSRIVIVPTGLAVGVPKGCEGQIRSRSGLACKYGITVVNSPGTIDSDYRGEIKVGLINLSQIRFTVEPGMRIAQLVIMPIPLVSVEEVCNLDETYRNDGGFGHTGA